MLGKMVIGEKERKTNVSLEVFKFLKDISIA